VSLGIAKMCKPHIVAENLVLSAATDTLIVVIGSEAKATPWRLLGERTYNTYSFLISVLDGG
jgi:hypothetical protein